MKKTISDIIDLLNLIDLNFSFDSFLDYLIAGDIILLLSKERVNDDNFDTYRSLLQAFGPILLPHFIQSQPDLNPNIFGSDLSKMKLSQLDTFVDKRISMYNPEVIKSVQDLLDTASDTLDETNQIV